MQAVGLSLLQSAEDRGRHDAAWLNLHRTFVGADKVGVRRTDIAVIAIHVLLCGNRLHRGRHGVFLRVLDGGANSHQCGKHEQDKPFKSHPAKEALFPVK